MAKPNHVTSPAAQRKKMVIAALLGVALLVVLRWKSVAPDSADAGGSARQPTSDNPTESVARSAREESAAAPDASIAESTRWPELDMRRILAQNPFHGGRTVAGVHELAEAPSPGAGPSSLSSAARRVTSSSQSGPSGTVSPPAAFGADVAAMFPVTAIVTGGGRPAALIGDRLLSENDFVDEHWQIVTIHERGVVLGEGRSEESEPEGEE